MNSQMHEGDYPLIFLAQEAVAALEITLSIFVARDRSGSKGYINLWLADGYASYVSGFCAAGVGRGLM